MFEARFDWVPSNVHDIKTRTNTLSYQGEEALISCWYCGKITISSDKFDTSIFSLRYMQVGDVIHANELKGQRNLFFSIVMIVILNKMKRILTAYVPVLMISFGAFAHLVPRINSGTSSILCGTSCIMQTFFTQMWKSWVIMKKSKLLH